MHSILYSVYDVCFHPTVRTYVRMYGLLAHVVSCLPEKSAENHKITFGALAFFSDSSGRHQASCGHRQVLR